MPIFQDSNGLAVKFFFQKDILQDVQAELCDTITSLGGRVEAKVPRQGYILVQPGTPEEERLRLCWTSSDRPERYFVPYTFVEACKVAGMLLKQIFIEDGAPIPMHIHPSIANVNARIALSNRIANSGGDPHASIQSSRVILADPQSDVFQHLVKVFQGVPDKYIESYLWVKKCIERGTCVYTPMVYKNPGGRRPGEERTQFTEQDEQNLCNWIAQKIPYKEIGGRTGNRLYQQLCDLAGDPEYAWVARHTWQSWRERYKKNSGRLDNIIASIVEQTRPQPGEKGQYGYVRQPEEKPKRNRKRKARSTEELQQLSHQEEFVQHLEPQLGSLSTPGSSQLLVTVDPSQMNSQSLPHIPTPMPSLQDIADAEAYAALMPGPSSIPLVRADTRRSPDEEELDEDSSQWAVRVGNAPPPAWAKGERLEGAVTSQRANKRARIEPSGSIHIMSPHSASISSPPPPISTDAIVAIANLHVLDQSIRDIAKAARFTVEEVQEYYNKSGDLTATRTRFQRMRAELNAKFNDDV
ncbi:hypothetical protein CPB83DRAFT_40638 [Crepidotus variabilis]|uniref:DNA-binding protein RAP1 n=1 Tax=Crepidotus variabilis TaxID=179855 RepID=A0A9P6EVM7_9AGAR|nr:hypothetical protein CPB83DRAFT_40638 [Crepidotus variabilis]